MTVGEEQAQVELRTGAAMMIIRVGGPGKRPGAACQCLVSVYRGLPLPSQKSESLAAAAAQHPCV